MTVDLSLPCSLYAGLMFALAVHITPVASAQGTLTPLPGPPAPTMKTLDQVEARTVVNATNTPGDATNTFIIAAPGSYYLTGNIKGALGKHGISVQASDVTLDLNGFALISGGGEATRGVNTTTPISGFCLRNGSVRGWTGGGVRADFAITRAEKLSLSDNTGATGMVVGNGSIVMDCVASGNATGFFCPDRTQISNCIATLNTGAGFDCTSYVNIIDCTSSRNGGHGFVVLSGCSITRCSATRNVSEGIGIVAGDGCAITNCTVTHNGSFGIFAENGCTIADCTVSNNGSDGLRIGNDNTVRGCTFHANMGNGVETGSNCHVMANTSDANGGSGIYASGAGNRIDGNSCNANVNSGVFAIYGVVVRNSARGNATAGGTHQDFRISSTLIVNMGYGLTLPDNISPWANIVH